MLILFVQCASSRAARKPGSVVDGHLSRACVSAGLERPTFREGTGSPLSGIILSETPPFLVLLRMGFTLTACVTTDPVGSYPAFSPLPLPRRLFSVALSLGSLPPAVSRHPCPSEPGLSSRAGSLPCRRPSGLLVTTRIASDVSFERFLMIRMLYYLQPADGSQLQLMAEARNEYPFRSRVACRYAAYAALL